MEFNFGALPQYLTLTASKDFNLKPRVYYFQNPIPMSQTTLFTLILKYHTSLK